MIHKNYQNFIFKKASLLKCFMSKYQEEPNFKRLLRTTTQLSPNSSLAQENAKNIQVKPQLLRLSYMIRCNTNVQK